MLIGLALAAAGVLGAGSAMAWGHHSRVFVGFNVGPYWGPSPWWGPYPYYYPAPVYYPPVVVQQLQTFCSEELGGFYLDVLKDRLYTAARTSPARRSAQTALALIRDEMLKFMAPVLSFTAEEAWRTIHPQDASVFVHTWRKEVADLALTPEFVAKWDIIRAYRAELLKKLEEAREAGEIGSSLQAEADIIAPPDVEIVNPDHHIATLDDAKAKLTIDLTVEVGRGYRTIEEGAIKKASDMVALFLVSRSLS